MALEKSESVVRDIKRRTRRKYSAEEKITIVLEGLRGEENISAICRHEVIAPNLYYRWMQGLQAKHLLVILDCCFAGMAVRGREFEVKGDAIPNVEEYFRDLIGESGKFLLMAGTDEQYSFGYKDDRGSVFTHAFIRGLTEARGGDINGDGFITITELYPWLKDNVSKEMKQKGLNLNPLMKDLGQYGVSKGEYFFVRDTTRGNR